jgi:tetratricopeptide (TPR) repeat protein
MTPRASAGAVLCMLLAAVLALSAAPRPAVRVELRGVEGLARAYDFILEARFDQVDAELRRACGPAPVEACDVLSATALWWRILLDPESRALDAEFTATADRAIRLTEAWVERAPTSAEAWFYLGGAYAVRVQWRVLRDEKMSAARDGKRILEALEEAVRLEPGLHDAYFAMGMYKYYADVAPAAAKFLRFLLLLPGGDRDEGLAEMLRARNKGRLLQGEADYQLHLIYLWYEGRTEQALELLRSLHAQYPANPLFMAQIAEIQDNYQHDVTASLASWRTLLAAGLEQRANAAMLAQTQARLGIARQLEVLHQTDQAIEHLQAIVAARPQAPFDALPLALLRLGEAHDRLGARAAAVSSYRAAIAAVGELDPYDIEDEAEKRLRRAPDAKKGRAYRLSLEGFRSLEQNDLPAATSALELSLALNPGDPVARYRLGRVLQARKNDVDAIAQFEMAIRGERTCPPPILGTAYLEAARLHERAGRMPQALSYYRAASTLFGAAAETQGAATRALTRLATK